MKEAYVSFLIELMLIMSKWWTMFRLLLAISEMYHKNHSFFSNSIKTKDFTLLAVITNVVSSVVQHCVYMWKKIDVLLVKEGVRILSSNCRAWPLNTNWIKDLWKKLCEKLKGKRSIWRKNMYSQMKISCLCNKHHQSMLTPHAPMMSLLMKIYM